MENRLQKIEKKSKMRRTVALGSVHRADSYLALGIKRYELGLNNNLASGEKTSGIE
jgi:hypothetical protein